MPTQPKILLVLDYRSDLKTYVHKATIEEALGSAGLRLSDCATFPVHIYPSGSTPEMALHQLRTRLRAAINRHGPDLIIAFGPQPSFALSKEQWPSKTDSIFQANEQFNRRGYVFEDQCGGPGFLATFSLEDCTRRNDSSGRNFAVLVHDLKKASRIARNGRTTYEREIEVVSTAPAARRAYEEIVTSTAPVASDIETAWRPDYTTTCVGFATSPERAFVFTPRVKQYSTKLLVDPAVRKIFHNGSYDTYHLKKIDNITVKGWTEDTSILWRAVALEFAGQSIKGGKRTQKSLRFLCSLFTDVDWWKDYDFSNQDQMYDLNGHDVCNTYLLWNALMASAIEIDTVDIYRHEMRIQPSLVRIQERGMLVDNKLREMRLDEIEKRKAIVESDILRKVMPIVEEYRDLLEKPHLFFDKRNCLCCRSAVKKRERCWSCAGFDKAPNKRDLLSLAPEGTDPKTKVEDLRDLVLGPCSVCGGGEPEEVVSFASTSSAQMIDVLYNILRIPKRHNKGKLTVDEERLKDLLGVLRDDQN